MAIQVGDRMPIGVFKELQNGVPALVSSSEIFDAQRTLLFSCPGAFTPKSSEQQVPSYLEHYDALLAHGVDAIVCISVNDAFVMHAWAESLEVGNKVRMLADGHAEYHTSIGLEMDCTRFTLGFRSHRFSMLVDDAIVALLNVEEPGGYKVSDASVILAQLTSLAR